MKRGIIAKTMMDRREKESTTGTTRKIRKLKHDGDAATSSLALPSKRRIGKGELEPSIKTNSSTPTTTTISRSRKKKIIDSDDDDDDDDDDDVLHDPSLDNELEDDEEHEDETPKNENEEQRMIKLLTETTFHPLRMKEALVSLVHSRVFFFPRGITFFSVGKTHTIFVQMSLSSYTHLHQSAKKQRVQDDMRPYLNKDVCDCETMADVRAAGYAFGSSESAERFLVEKMRPSRIKTWEYKVLAALVFTNIYSQQQQQQQLDKTDFSKIVTKFEKTIFGKGETKDQELGAKIYCETWRSQAVALFAECHKALESNNAGEDDKLALKASLLAELLLEFCKFTAKCKVLKSKAALDKIKDPAKYGIDFMLGLEQVRPDNQICVCACVRVCVCVYPFPSNDISTTCLFVSHFMWISYI
jgi:hypothetical protein